MVSDQGLAVNKPSRSDEVIDVDEQLRIANQVRAQFDSLAPKRPIKPSRSEPDPDASETHQPHPGPIPELERLNSLKSCSQVAFPKGGDGAVQEEFVETEYYKELVAIDKQHHTTGTGFIKVVKDGDENGSDSELRRLSENGEERKNGFFSGFKSNPATNDWTPSDEQVEYVSSKPIRSD